MKGREEPSAGVAPQAVMNHANTIRQRVSVVWGRCVFIASCASLERRVHGQGIGVWDGITVLEAVAVGGAVGGTVVAVGGVVAVAVPVGRVVAVYVGV